MKDACIVFYHSAAWDGIPGRQRLLMQAISRYLPVIYIEEVEDRRWHVTYHDRGQNVRLVRGLANALVRFERRKWNLPMWLICRWSLRWIKKSYKRVIFWNSENWLRPNRFIPHDYLVFDCIDPCFGNDQADLAPFERREKELLSRADLVFASAESLVENCRRHNSNVTLLNNACDPEDYSPQKIAETPKPGWWPTNGNPIAAYLGTLDWRFDFAATLAASRANPHVQFILAGNLLHELDSTAAELRALPNVLIPGRLSHDEGRYLLAYCTIGLIPFTVGPMNDAINPVKLYAYTLLGKPVVGTAIRELTCRPDICSAASSPAEFARLVAEAIASASDSERRNRLISFAMENTWDHRARAALARIFPAELSFQRQ